MKLRAVFFTGSVLIQHVCRYLQCDDKSVILRFMSGLGDGFGIIVKKTYFCAGLIEGVWDKVQGLGISFL